jgi:hypothetical protein
MNSSSEMKLQKIQRGSALFRTACTALFVPVVVIAIAASVDVVAGLTAHIDYHGQTFIPAQMDLPARLILLAVVLATAAVMLKALYHLRCLAGNYARRQIFTTDSARQIRQFGISCILWGLLKMLWVFLPLMTSGARSPVYGVSTDSILIGAVIVGLSWFAEMAAALREENDLTI